LVKDDFQGYNGLILYTPQQDGLTVNDADLGL
jgi:hypothetical protein